MTHTISSNILIYTDMPSIRNGTTEEDQKFLNSEAFVYRNRAEGIPVIYVERAFFNEQSILPNISNWARIIVHELSHMDVGTVDHHYAWQGINPRFHLTPDKAIVNADNWAFFAADCGGHLTENHIMQAMGVNSNG